MRLRNLRAFTDHVRRLGFGLCTDLGSLWWIPQQGDHTVHSSLAARMYLLVSTQLHDIQCVYINMYVRYPGQLEECRMQW